MSEKSPRMLNTMTEDFARASVRRFLDKIDDLSQQFDNGAINETDYLTSRKSMKDQIESMYQKFPQLKSENE